MHNVRGDKPGRQGHHHPMGGGRFHPADTFPGFFSWRKGFPNRFLRPAVLLLLAEKPSHGYELMGRLKDLGLGEGSIDPSILYRLLRFLEAEGLAESTLDDSGAGPARKVYRLTPEGREVLDFWATSLDSVTGFIEEFRRRYEKVVGD